MSKNGKVPDELEEVELERLKEKASGGSYEKFLRVMSKVPAVEPPEYDRLTAPSDGNGNL